MHTATYASPTPTPPTRHPLGWRWNTEPADLTRAYACDDHMPDHDEAYYRALDVAAAPRQVFRWLCQLRAAPYSYDWLDNWGRQSPQTLTPGLDELQVGQRAMSIFVVESFARVAGPDDPDAHVTFRIADRKAAALFGDVSITYAVIPRVSADGRAHARIAVKLLVRYPRSVVGKVMRQVLPFGDLIMMRRQLLNLKRLAER